MCVVCSRVFNSLFIRCGAQEALLKEDGCHICGKQVLPPLCASAPAWRCMTCSSAEDSIICTGRGNVHSIGSSTPRMTAQPASQHKLSAADPLDSGTVQDHVARCCPDRSAGPILPSQLGAWGQSPRPNPLLKVSGHAPSQ